MISSSLRIVVKAAIVIGAPSAGALLKLTANSVGKPSARRSSLFAKIFPSGSNSEMKVLRISIL